MRLFLKRKAKLNCKLNDENYPSFSNRFDALSAMNDNEAENADLSYTAPDHKIRPTSNIRPTG